MTRRPRRRLRLCSDLAMNCAGLLSRNGELGYAGTMKGYAVPNQLQRPGVRLRATARFGEGLATALWERSDHGRYRYEAPDHHTVCFAAVGGEGYRRRRGRRIQQSFGEGQSVILPAGVSSEWEASGKASVFHLYIPTALFDRRVVETLDAAPGSVSLRDDGFKRDPILAGIIRSMVLPLAWDEPADRMAMVEAGELLVGYLAAGCSERLTRGLQIRGGLAPIALRRVRDYVEANLREDIALDDLAAVTGLSPFHFAHAFKRSTGCSPHRYVLRRRIVRAKCLLSSTRLAVASVAQACGFGSPSHFSVRFRELTGVTPRQFTQAITAEKR